MMRGGALVGRHRRLRERHADRRVGFEGTPEPELFANLPERGQHFLTEEADTRLRVRARDEPIRRPESEDGRPRLLEQAPELRDHGLRRPRDDHLALDLVLEGRAAGIGPAPDRVLDERRPNRGREVARRGRPDRVREARELALHPHELAGVLHGLLLGLGDVAALEVAAVLGAARVARLRRDLIVELPDLLGRLDGGAQRDVGVALLRRPHDRLLAEHARDPDPRVRLLQRHRPRVHHAMLVVRALPPERPGLRPRLDDQLVRLLEALAVERGVDAGGELLLAAAPHEPDTRRPRETMSIIASSSASRTGFSASGSGFPSSTIFTRFVVAARIDAKMLHLACMQNGALWCSFSMMPSKPTASASR